MKLLDIQLPSHDEADSIWQREDLGAVTVTFHRNPPAAVELAIADKGRAEEILDSLNAEGFARCALRITEENVFTIHADR